MNNFKKVIQSKSFFMIISVLVAIISWLLVLNVTNPIKERTLEIPLAVLNSNHPGTLDLSDQTVARPVTVTVTVSGREDTLNNLTTKELSAFIDLKAITKKGITTVKVNKPECSRLGVSVKDYYPKEIDFVFDTQTQRYLDVLVEYNASLLAPGYEYVSVVAEPDKIPIVGLTNVIDTVDHIKIDLTDAISEGSINSNTTASFIGKYISVNGEDISSSFNTEKVTVHITVAKRVPIKYEITGKPNDDYYFESSTISLGTVLVKGEASELAKISEVNLGKIDISDAKQTIKKTFNLSDYIPSKLSIESTSEATVTAKIAKYDTKELTIKTSDINCPGRDNATYVYDIASVTLKVKLKGKTEDLKNITVASLDPTINLSGKTVGYYNMAIQFNGINGEKVTVVGAYTVPVTIEYIPVTPPDDPSQDPQLPEGPEAQG